MIKSQQLDNEIYEKERENEMHKSNITKLENKLAKDKESL